MSKGTKEQTKLPTMKIQGKDYVLVKDRVLYFNETYPNGSIRTEIDQVLSQWGQWVVKATVTPDATVPARVYVGHSQAATDAPGLANKQAALENAETSAIGRALAMMGIGVIDSIASVDEMRKAGADVVSSGNREAVQAQNAKTIAGLNGINPQDVEDSLKSGSGPLPWELPKCETCGADTVHKTGTSEKTGKDWEALFCSSGERSHAKWL